MPKPLRGLRGSNAVEIVKVPILGPNAASSHQTRRPPGRRAERGKAVWGAEEPGNSKLSSASLHGSSDILGYCILMYMSGSMLCNIGFSIVQNNSTAWETAPWSCGRVGGGATYCTLESIQRLFKNKLLKPIQC